MTTDAGRGVAGFLTCSRCMVCVLRCFCHGESMHSSRAHLLIFELSWHSPSFFLSDSSSVVRRPSDRLALWVPTVSADVVPAVTFWLVDVIASDDFRRTERRDTQDGLPSSSQG